MKELKEIEKYRLYSYELCKEKEDPKQIKCCKPSAENDYCGVHVMSGIPNRAAALILSKMNWDYAGMMFYKVMTKRLNFKSTFKDYAQALLSECEAYPGTCSIVEEALKEVGIIKD
jgi:Zn-dependent metalloprotease